MGHPRSLSPLWLVTTILLAYLSYTTTQTQSHLVCRRPDSLNCLAWLIVGTTENKGTKITGTLSKTISTYCGLSSLRPIVHRHHRIYVQIQEVQNIPSTKLIFCQEITIMGQIYDFQETTKVLEKGERLKRQTFTPKGRYRGQTQSQYLAIDRGNGKDEGKAEAHSAADSSRAVVSGNSGMGQAQSQSMYDPNCDDCGERKVHEIENLKHPMSSNADDSTWPKLNGPTQSLNRGYNQNSPRHYGESPYIPTLGNKGPLPKGNEKEIFVPQNMGGLQPESKEVGNRPISTTHGGYGPSNFPGANGYQPITSQIGNGYKPISESYHPSDKTGSRHFGPNGIPTKFEPVANSNDKGYLPNSDMSPENYRDINTRLGGINGGRQGSSDRGGPDSGLYASQGGYLPEYGMNKYNAQMPGNIPSGTGNELNQNGIRPFGNGIPRDSMIINKPTSHMDSGYAPGSQISSPNVGVKPYESINGLTKQNPLNLNQRESGVPHYSIASGPYPRSDGSSVYCCVVPNSAHNGNMYPNYRPGDANNLMTPESTLNQQLDRSSGQYGGNQFIPEAYGNYGQYDPINTRRQYEPKNSIGTSVPQGSFSSPGGQYETAVRPYGSTTGRGSYPPGNLDSRGTLHSPDQPYNLNGPSGSVSSNGQYIPVGNSNNSPMPGGQLLEGSAGIPTGTGLHYGTNVPGSPGVSAGSYRPNNVRSNSNSPTETRFPYGQSNSGTGTNPGGQYGVNIPIDTTQQFRPGSTTSGQYRPVASSGPQGQYGPTGHNSGDRPNSYINQHEPGISGSFPGGQYTPGEHKNIGQYGTDNQGGRPVGDYGSSSPTDSLGSRGQYEPDGIAGRYHPGSPLRPSGEYRPNNVGEPTGNRGQYSPSGPISTTGPNGENRIGSPGVLVGSVGQYDPGNLEGAIRHGNQYGQNVPFSGQNVPGGANNPGDEGQFKPGGPGGSIDQYGHDSPGKMNAVYGPGGPIRPFDNTGQYGSRNSFGGVLPGGQYGVNGPGGDIGNIGQYIPGTSGDSAGQARPLDQYSSNNPDSSVGPGAIRGQFGPNGIRTDQYGPDGSDGSIRHGRPYGSNLGNQPGEQVGPGATESFVPGGKLTPNGVGTSYGHYNNGGPGGLIGDYNGVPQNYVDPNSINADEDDSVAEASVAQNINGTTASASSKGGNEKGRAQTNVQGTYTGSGSFQAQAQITGENKEAQSEVNGGKKGASSSASGSGKNNKSQANVELGSETGSVQTQSQSNGVMHSSNSQVQGSVKGGMADAQARGPGSTSSQAQIGFTPYKNAEKSTHDLQKIPFMGGGIASAQSSGRIGQSQSQLHGTFKYGISYSGAAQSGASLDKDAIFPNRLSFDKINVFDEKEKNIDVDKINIDVTELPDKGNGEALLITEAPSPPAISKSSVPDIPNSKESGLATTTENNLGESMKKSESRYSGHTHLDHHQSEATNQTDITGPTLSSSRRSFQTSFSTIPEYEFTTDRDDTQPEYDTDVGYDGDGNEANDVEQAEYSNYDEYTKDPPTQYLQNPNSKRIDVQQTTGGNTQHIVLGSLKNQNADIIQKDSGQPDESKVYQPGERVPGTDGYTIPIGFTGSVKSVASKENTYVVGSKDSVSQAQTVTLTPGTGKVKYAHPSSYGRYVKAKNLRSLHSVKEDDNKYMSVSKSVTRALDSNDNVRKQYSHTYYTKSSSCGYFTFTCTMVSSAEGRKKVCKPKMPTNSDGTPIRC